MPLTLTTTCLCRLPHHGLHRLPGAHRRQGQPVQSDVCAAQHLQVSSVMAHAICLQRRLSDPTIGLAQLLALPGLSVAPVADPCSWHQYSWWWNTVWAYAQRQLLPVTATRLAAQLLSSWPACVELPGQRCCCLLQCWQDLRMRPAHAQVVSASTCLPLRAARQHTGMLNSPGMRRRPVPASASCSWPASGGNTGI